MKQTFNIGMIPSNKDQVFDDTKASLVEQGIIEENTPDDVVGIKIVENVVKVREDLNGVKQALADAGLVSPTTPNEMLPTAIEEGMKNFIKPTGTLDITENGTHDVTDKASVNVNVAGDGISLNIHYVLEAPEDTNMLWVKLENEPSKVEISNNVEGGNEQIKLSKYTLPINLGSMVCETVGDKIYIMSGAVGSDDYVNTIYMFDPKNGSFITKSSTFSNSEGASHSSAVVGKYIYIYT